MSESVLAPVSNMDPNAASRQEVARLACEQAGIVWPGTILPPGTALYSSGVEKLKNDRAAWRRLPLASEVIGLVKGALSAEDRKDFPVNVQQMAFREGDGRLVRRENLENYKKEGLGYGPHTLRQLVAQIDPLDDRPKGFVSALLYLSDEERAQILNKRISEADPATQVVLRTKLPHSGDRIARAALSGIYGSVTDYDIAESIGQTVSGDQSGRLDYKPGDTMSRFEVVWPSEIPIETFVVGDVHYAMLSITNSETGQGSIRIAPAVVRARCANLTISIGEGTEVSIRHVGDTGQLVFRLRKAIRAALDDMEPLLRTIVASAKIPLGDVWTPEKAFQAIAKKYEQPKVAVEAWKTKMLSSGYPASVWGIGSAISEAAHDRGTWVEEHEWERVSSEVMQKASKIAMENGGQVVDIMARVLEN